MVESEPVVPVNPAVVAPADTVTEAGTVRATVLLLESDTVAPEPPAAWFKVTVQEVVPGALTVVGLQVRLLTVTGTGTVMLPPVLVRVRGVPAGEDATVLPTPMGMVPEADAAKVTFTTAAVPF